MELDMKQFIEHFSEKLTKEYSKQQDFVFELEDLLAKTDLQKNLRISQIDLIDILSTPDPRSGEIEDLIDENGLEVKDFRLPRMTAQYRNEVENHLRPYGIDLRDWNNYHGQNYDAFDFPKVPKRSISISFDQGKSGAWAPNGYGKTFAFEKVLRLLEMPSESDPFDAFENFLRQCTALLQPNPDAASTLDEAQSQKKGKRLIPFRMLCFSVQAFSGDFATDMFSVSIEIEYNSSGHYLSSSFYLHVPETRENFVVEDNVVLPNWVLRSQAEALWEERKKYTSEESDWREIGLRLLLNMKIDYLELPRVAFSSKAEQIVQENIAITVDACIDLAVSHDYDDLEIDKPGLLTSLNKLKKNRFLIPGLVAIINDIFDEDDSGPGKNALLDLISKLTDIQNELQNLVGAEGESWRLQCELLTPSYERWTSLDIFNPIYPTANLIWNHLSFGQRNELLFKSTLLRTKYSRAIDMDKQRVLVIDEPEAGRSEEWVSHLIDDINRFEPESSVLILSHRGIVLESANPEGKYKILHTALPDEEDFEEDELLEWNQYKNSAGDVSIVDQKMTLIRAFTPSPIADTWAASFPETVTPSAESGWIRFGGPNHLWYLKPTHLDGDTANQMSNFITNEGLTNDSYLKIFWDGFQWTPTNAQSRYRLLKGDDNVDLITKRDNDELYLTHLDYPGTLTIDGFSKTAIVKDSITKFSNLPGITTGGIRLPKKPEHLMELINFANKHESLAADQTLLNQEKLRLKDKYKISKNLSNNFINFLKQTNADNAIPNNLDIDEFVKILKRNISSPTQALKDRMTKSKGSFKNLEAYYREVEKFYSEHPSQVYSNDRSKSRMEAFFEYLRDNLEVELRFEIEDLIPKVERVTADSDGTVLSLKKTFANKLNINKYPIGSMDESDIRVKMEEWERFVVEPFGRKYPEYDALRRTPYPLSSLPFDPFSKSKVNYSASLDSGIALAITSLDSMESHPHSADFDFKEYAWCLKTLGVIRNNECSISDYACELILRYAENLQRCDTVDPLTLADAKEHNPEVGEDDTILLDDYIRTSAQEISKLDKQIDYDQFDDPCGPTALIRVDSVLDDGVTMELGYRCMNCDKRYDERYQEIE